MQQQIDPIELYTQYNTQLRESICGIRYINTDGELRSRIATLAPTMIPISESIGTKPLVTAPNMSVYDVVNKQWITFNIMKVTEFQELAKI